MESEMMTVMDEQTFAEKTALLRKPFDKDEIETLPKYVGKKGPDGKVPKDAYRTCPECNTRHALPAIHLDYVGHAGITQRLLDVDPFWTIEPMAYNAAGLPLFDGNGGLWCWMTVLGVKRMCYGDSQGKQGPNAVKEAIGDAIRNGAMRFGCGTYLWSKSERAEHMREFQGPSEAAQKPPAPRKKAPTAQKPNEDDTALLDAKKTCTQAMREYAASHGSDEKKLADGVRARAKQMQGDSDPGFWLMVADEFRSMK